MQNWQKKRNFRKYENVDGSYTYIILVDGKKVKVSKEIYTAYAKGGYKMENMKALKNNRILKDSKGRAVRDEHGNAILLPEREVSLENLNEKDWKFISTTPSPEDEVIAAEYSEVEELHRCIALLSEYERDLILQRYI